MVGPVREDKNWWVNTRRSGEWLEEGPVLTGMGPDGLG